MMMINLLPYHLRPIKRTPVPYILSVLALAAAVAGMVMLFLNMQAQIMIVDRDLQRVTKDLADLQEVVDEYNALARQKGQLADKITTIAEIVRDRIIWSQQLWHLSRLAPDNLWYSGVEVGNKTVRETQYQPDPQTKEMKPKEVAVTKPTLKVSGYVIETERGRYDVSGFARAAESDPEFADIFQLDTSSLKDTEFEGFPVREFTLEFLIVPGGGAQ